VLAKDSLAERVVSCIGVADLREQPDQAVWEIASGSPGRDNRGPPPAAGHCMPVQRYTVGRDMNEPDDQLGVHEELQGADPIPDVFPGQDPNVDREWEEAKEDPMGGESPSS
jgi:hypothetical protein